MPGFIIRAAGALIALGATAASAAAQTSPPPLLAQMFVDHAVLQRGREIPVWGWAKPGEKVTVGFDGASVSAKADKTGAWRANLPAHVAGGPYTLTARAESGAEAKAADVLVGDVYLCSGQSNMEFQTEYATNAFGTLGSAKDDQLRLFNVTRTTADTPQARLKAEDHWTAAESATVGPFSAVCYFFGRQIRQYVKVPIGLIASSWGGTIIEAWMSEGALHKAGGFEKQLDLAAVNRRDPAAAQTRFRQSMDAWWAKNDPGIGQGWAGADFDAADWDTITPGEFWESSGKPALANFDGLVWYRTEFELTAAQAAQGARLELGPADDIDATYLNGREVGSTTGWDTPRAYDLKPGALKAGRNVLATGILDTGGGGGWWGPVDQKALVFADGTRVSLPKTWRYKISAPISALTTPPRPPSDGPNGVAVLYNGMIAPIAPYGLSGVLWYQGEANASAPSDYAKLLPAWMADWRRGFEAPELPFFIAQLANFGGPATAPQKTSWGDIRDVQRRVVAADPHAAMAVTIDIGDRFDIHPTQKLIVARRLARAAGAMIYGEALTYLGPTAEAAVRDGGAVRVRFGHGPLLTYSAARPIAFELCDASRACRFVDAKIDGGDVVLDAGGGPSAFVRYCWGDAPFCNLYNGDDLPASPFEIAVK